MSAKWRYFNPNPEGKHTGDCVIRAICAVTAQDWGTTYTGAALQGYVLSDMPSGNYVWGAYLRSKGFKRAIIPNECPDCYTVGDFAAEHPRGRFVLGCGDPAVAVINGDVWDTYDSTDKIPIYYFYKDD